MLSTNTYKALIFSMLIPFTLASSITSEYTTDKENPDYCSSIDVNAKWDSNVNSQDVYTGVAYANNNKGPFTVIGTHSTDLGLRFNALHLDSSFKDIYWFAISTNGFNLGLGDAGGVTTTITEGNLITGNNKISMTDDKVLIGFTWNNNGLPDNNDNVHKLSTATCATPDTFAYGPSESFSAKPSST